MLSSLPFWFVRFYFDNERTIIVLSVWLVGVFNASNTVMPFFYEQRRRNAGAVYLSYVPRLIKDTPHDGLFSFSIASFAPAWRARL